MAEPGPERPPPADLEAAIAALPAKKEALREAFDRLAACSPYPLPFTWEDIDAHLSGIQSSISRRFRQVQVLEAARQTHTIPASAETRSSENPEEEEEEEEVEEIEEEEEEEEEDDENENDDEEEEEEEEEGEGEEEEASEEEVEEEEVEEEVEEEEVEEEVEEAEDAAMYEREQKADEEMRLTNDDEQNAKEEPGASGEEWNAEEGTVTKKIKVAEEGTSKEVPDEDEVEPDAEDKEEPPCVEPGTKSANKASLKNGMIQNQVEQAPACGSKDLTAVCAGMDANKLAMFICGADTSLGGNLPLAMLCAPDAAALALQVVKLFLSNKRFKATKAWNKCVGLIRCVSATASKPSADVIEQAKQVAKDWKEMIDKLDCPGDPCMLSAWGLLYFLISYNIVSDFDSSEIIRLFAMVPHHKQKKNTIELCKGLGISDRITDLINYLIGKGQHLDVFHLANVFNLSDKYPLLSLLTGYIETAKQTSVEIQSKSLISAIPKEITNLWVAHHLAKQKITDCSQRSTIMAEIKVLLDEYARKKTGLAKACTSNSQPQQKQDNKKRKKAEQELHKGQENMQQLQGHKQNNQQQKQNKEENQMRESVQKQQKNRSQEMQQHLKRPRPCTLKLPTPAVAMVLNVGQIGHLGRSPCFAMPGGPSYTTQSCLPGAGGAPPFAPPFGAAQYIRPFHPFYPHPQFYPR